MRVRYLYLRGGIFWFRGPQISGVRPRAVSLGTRDLDEAISLRNALLADLRQPAGPESVAGAIARFLAEGAAAGRHTLKTSAVYRSSLGLFAKFAGQQLSIAAVDGALVDAWAGSLLRGLSRATAEAYLTQLRAFLAWCVRERLLVRSPFAHGGSRVPRSNASRAHEFYSRGARDLLLRHAAGISEDLEMVMMLGFFAGLRYREICEATADWIREGPNGLSLHVRATADYGLKWHKQRSVACGARLSEFLRHRHDGGAGFLVAPAIRRGRSDYRWDARRQWERAHAGLALRRYGFHAMRHTFASLHVAAGTSMALVAQWLGVGVGVAFHHYARFSDGQGSADNAD